MFTLSRVATPAMVLVVCLLGSTSAQAVSTILSGMFDGSEPVFRGFPGSECTDGQSGFRQNTFQVSSAGKYILSNPFDALHYHGAMTVLYRVYQGSFNPKDPLQNLVSKSSNYPDHILSTGVTYVLVVRQCVDLEGPWVLAFTGPGSVVSDAVANVPNFTKGKFSSSDPTKPWSPYENKVTRYKQSGPIRVSRDGTYYLADTLFVGGAQISLQVYTARVNPADPWANLIGSAALGSPLIELRAGQDYYFVTQWIGGNRDGEFLYVVAPPAPFRINPGLAGAWYNSDTPGQGFFLTVYEKLNQVFLGWFTFTDDPAAVDYGHRWMTAFGKFEGSSADLALEWTSGGAFNSATPVPEQLTWGEMRLDFADCSSGKVTYAFGPDDTGGYQVEEIPIRRHTDDTVALCESLYAGPGMPGPL
jgi:hypothetical protein